MVIDSQYACVRTRMHSYTMHANCRGFDDRKFNIFTRKVKTPLQTLNTNLMHTYSLSLLLSCRCIDGCDGHRCNVHLFKCISIQLSESVFFFFSSVFIFFFSFLDFCLEIWNDKMSMTFAAIPIKFDEGSICIYRRQS